MQRTVLPWTCFKKRQLPQQLLEQDSTSSTTCSSAVIGLFVFRAGFSPHTHGQSFVGERPESFAYEYSHRQCCILARDYGRSIDTLSHVRTFGHQELRMCMI